VELPAQPELTDTPDPTRSYFVADPKPVQFGYKAQVVDNEDGIVLDHNLEQGNPPDAPQLAPAVERIIKRTGRKPRPPPPIVATARTASTAPCTTSVSGTS